MISLKHNIGQVWQNVASKVNKAVVFIDDPSAECLHWNGGAMFLFSAGALEVKEFSSFENGKSEQRKAVFILSGPLYGTTMNILCDILKASSFQYVIVISSLSPAMHTIVNHGLGEDESRTFAETEDQLLEWMGNMNYTVEIMYLPAVCAPITQNLFVIPEHCQIFPLLPTDLDILLPTVKMEHKRDALLSDIEFNHLPKELQLSLKLFICSLNGMLESLNISEDVYALGQTSRIVATELANLPWAKHRRKTAQQKASLLIVDRTLDIVNVVGHHWETLLDRILSVLPKLPQHTNDVCVNMAPVCSVLSNPEHQVIASGCLAHPSDDTASGILQILATLKQKEALMEVNRQLVEAATRDKLPIKLTGRPGRVTAEQLNSHISNFRGKATPVYKNRGLLQMVLAVLETLQHPDQARIDSLLGVEKGLVQTVGEQDGPSPLRQLIQTIEKEKDTPQEERLFKLEDIFLLLIFLYSLLEDKENVELISEEKELQGAIIKSILSGKDDLPPFLLELVGEEPKKETVTLVIQDIFEKLRCLSRTRENMQQFDTIHEPGSLTSQACLKPLLKAVVEAIVDPNKPELLDIVYKSTGLRDLIKSGFGLFMNVSKPRPSDHPVLIIFVIGGTTCTEVRQIMEAANKSDVQVIVGSTRLLSPADLLQQIFVSDHLHPKLG